MFFIMLINYFQLITKINHMRYSFKHKISHRIYSTTLGEGKLNTKSCLIKEKNDLTN